MVDDINKPSLPAWMSVTPENTPGIPAGPAVPVPQKKPPFKKIIFGLLAVFLLVGLGFGSYEVYQRKIKPSKKPEIFTGEACGGTGRECCFKHCHLNPDPDYPNPPPNPNCSADNIEACCHPHCQTNEYTMECHYDDIKLCHADACHINAVEVEPPNCSGGPETSPSPSPSPGGGGGGGGGGNPSPSPSPGGGGGSPGGCCANPSVAAGCGKACPGGNDWECYTGMPAGCDSGWVCVANVCQNANICPCGGGNGDCSGCGIEPSYGFNKPPFQIGPFSEAGNLVIYYAKLDVGGPLNVYLTTHEGSKVVNLDTNDKQRLVTNVSVNANETITLNKIEGANQGSPACAPDAGNPWLSWGQIGVNTDSTCGSGLNGPPTGGQCTPPMQKIDVNSAISWAQGFGKPLISKECWADWREWPGDYDFNDYFLMFSYEPSPGRQDICDHTDITPQGGNLNPGGSVKIDLTAKVGSQVKANSLLVYNSNNLNGPGDPKFVCVSGTKPWADGCPDGYRALSFVHSPSSNLSDSFTLSYNDLHVKDYNTPGSGSSWVAGSYVANLQFNGYFTDMNDQTSLPNPYCVEYSHLLGSSPSPSPSPSPSQTLSCSSISRNPASILNLGDSVTFTCSGQTANVAIDHYEFRLSKDAGSTYTLLPSASTGGDTTNPYQIAASGDYIVQCRVCSDDSSDHCTNWGEAGGWTPGPNDG